jgi:hypothetical protein
MNRRTLIILVACIVVVLGAIFLIIYGFQMSQTKKYKVSVSIQLVYYSDFKVYYPVNDIARNYTLVFYERNSSTIAATVIVHLYRLSNVGIYHNYPSEQVNVVLSIGDYTAKQFDDYNGSFLKQFEISVAKDTSFTISG